MNRTEVLEKITEYICNTYSISKQELYNNTCSYIKNILRKIEENNKQVKRLRLKKQEIHEDIEDLKASMVGSQCFNEVVPGRNNGQIKNTIAEKYTKRLELQEELTKVLIEKNLIEKSLEDHNQLLEEFINLIPSPNQRIVMSMTYVDCMTNSEIAAILFYTVGAIDKERWRSVRKLSKILEKYLMPSK